VGGAVGGGDEIGNVEGVEVLGVGGPTYAAEHRGAPGPLPGLVGFPVLAVADHWDLRLQTIGRIARCLLWLVAGVPAARRKLASASVSLRRCLTGRALDARVGSAALARSGRPSSPAIAARGSVRSIRPTSRRSRRSKASRSKRRSA